MLKENLYNDKVTANKVKAMVSIFCDTLKPGSLIHTSFNAPQCRPWSSLFANDVEDLEEGGGSGEEWNGMNSFFQISVLEVKTVPLQCTRTVMICNKSPAFLKVFHTNR